ncbi:MAG: hypothetical protein ACYC6F_18920 [Longimicrobiales bacterium]
MLLHLHSGLRYLVLLAGVAVIVYALRGVALKQPHDRTMKRLAITFRSLMDVTLFSGIVMVTVGYNFNADAGMHVVLMVLATAVSHVVPAVMRKRRQDQRTLMPYAVATAAVIALVIVATISLGRPAFGWSSAPAEQPVLQQQPTP